MSLKNVLKKAASLMVEFPEESLDSTSDYTATSTKIASPEPRTVENVVSSIPGPNLEDIKVMPATVQSALAPGGMVRFETVYQNAGLTPVPFSAEQALEVIASLPIELPIAVKRSTVHATLGAMGKALGVNTETVIADASRKLAALDAYVDALDLQSKQYVSKLNTEITTLQTRIAEINQEIERTNTLLSGATASCTAEGDRLDDVLEFFTLDVGVSKNAQT